MKRFVSERLFGPLGMDSRAPRSTTPGPGSLLLCARDGQDFASSACSTARADLRRRATPLRPTGGGARAARSVDVSDHSLYSLQWWDSTTATARFAPLASRPEPSCSARARPRRRACWQDPDERSVRAGPLAGRGRGPRWPPPLSPPLPAGAAMTARSSPLAAACSPSWRLAEGYDGAVRRGRSSTRGYRRREHEGGRVHTRASPTRVPRSRRRSP